ncbi:helix-turn-helix domain-containing protein [Natronosalvus rutilus]|uniref:Helix-turn-helix domain-containing protein n=1 Tax=Natronosalvus rutilus TaxID=2953753 RepID=A0A9E7SV44_9EURY|nr:helix-turn-helix domain-containing protein [Natronosalvus rutilus]UTF55479.1 helix-turn-helix domain-containing protein [Natronosalvus rutilus]
MTTVAELEVPAGHFAAATAFERIPSLEFQFAGVVGEGPPLVWVSGASRNEIQEALEADPTLSVLASLTDASRERWLFRLEFDAPITQFQEVIADHGGAILETTGEDHHWTIELLFHDRESLSAAHDELLDQEFSVSVRRMTELDGDLSEETPLTETQYETIVTAHELGYFDVPRKVTLKELADELGISHQALSERLRRSHAALVSAKLADGDQQKVDL